jgi:hypothetical protein
MHFIKSEKHFSLELSLSLIMAIIGIGRRPICHSTICYNWQRNKVR